MPTSPEGSAALSSQCSVDYIKGVTMRTLYVTFCVIVLSVLLAVSCTIAVPNDAANGSTVSRSPSFQQGPDLSKRSSALPTLPDDKTYADFLEKILAGESSIDPNDAFKYFLAFTEPDSHYPFTTYPIVEEPGRVLRFSDGTFQSIDLGIEGYFNAIGVLDLYDVNTPYDLNMLKKMQYNVINYLGFIGYQFSESDLQVLGYYNYARDAQGHPIYYVDVDVSNWANGVREKLMNIKQPDGSTETVLVTDVNRWGGTFTGRNGISSREDFMSSKADAIAKDHFKYKYDNIVKLLATQNKKITDFIGTTLRWNELTPKLTPPSGIPEEIVVTYSGLLAGAHLRGAQGVYNLLILHQNNQDESGTAILGYLYTFGSYETPWGK